MSRGGRTDAPDRRNWRNGSTAIVTIAIPFEARPRRLRRSRLPRRADGCHSASAAPTLSLSHSELSSATPPHPHLALALGTPPVEPVVPVASVAPPSKSCSSTWQLEPTRDPTPVAPRAKAAAAAGRCAA